MFRYIHYSSIFSIIAAVFAVFVLVRGILLLTVPRWFKKRSIKMLEQKKQFFTQIGILAIMFSLVFFVILLPKIGILPLVTAVLGTGMFVTGFVLLVAREKCIALWKELINRPDTSLRVMGILHILCALLLTYVLLIQNY